MRSKILGFVAVLLTLCLMTGCFAKPKNRNAMDRIKGDIECEFRVGKDAKTHKDAIDTDIVFDKDKFVELFNEKAQYTPSSIKYHTDDLSLRINAQEQPDEWGSYFMKLSKDMTKYWKPILKEVREEYDKSSNDT